MEPQRANGIRARYIAWEIQRTCNLGCRFCYSSSWNLHRSKQLEEKTSPTVDVVKNGLDFLKQADIGLEYINWTGGEPLIRHPELGEILRHSRALGFRNILSTNANYSDCGMTSEKFFQKLQEWSDYLDVLSVSLDSPDEKINNEVMRVRDDKGNPFSSNKPSNQFSDARDVINAFKQHKFPFALKINTLVTSKNSQPFGFVEMLIDVPCIWHLVEFNPRQCPPHAIDEFQLEENAFARMVLDVERLLEAKNQPCKFSITTRLYDGDNNPYCFLVINTDGQVLLPYGKEHKKVQVLPRNGETNASHQWVKDLQGKSVV